MMTRCVGHTQCADVEGEVSRGTMRGTILRDMTTGEQVHFDHIATGREILDATAGLSTPLHLSGQHDGGLFQIR
jgi:hypothetical protein